MQTEPSPAPPTVQDPKADKILSAAHELFTECGYAATSMDLVAKRARASKTTLYTRFPSKEALFAAAVTAECERHGMRFDAAAFDDMPIDEALFQIGRRFLDLVWSPAALRVEPMLMAEAGRFPEIARIFFETGISQTRAAVSRFIAHAQAQGRLAAGDSDFIAQQFLGGLKGSLDCSIGLGQAPPPCGGECDAYLRRAIALFLHGAKTSPQRG